MGRNNSKRARRDNNLVASRNYIRKTVTTYHKPRLHRSPITLRTPAADAVLSRVRRPPSPTIADNRFWHPLEARRPIVRYDGRPTPSLRLYDPPRPISGRVKKWSQRRHSATVQSRPGPPSRFGPKLDRQTKAILAFVEPKTLPLCTRRLIRKQVLHSKGIAGGQVRPPKFKAHSKVSCHG